MDIVATVLSVFALLWSMLNWFCLRMHEKQNKINEIKLSIDSLYWGVFYRSHDIGQVIKELGVKEEEAPSLYSIYRSMSEKIRHVESIRTRVDLMSSKLSLLPWRLKYKEINFIGLQVDRFSVSVEMSRREFNKEDFMASYKKGNCNNFDI